VRTGAGQPQRHTTPFRCETQATTSAEEPTTTSTAGGLLAAMRRPARPRAPQRAAALADGRNTRVADGVGLMLVVKRVTAVGVRVCYLVAPAPSCASRAPSAPRRP